MFTCTRIVALLACAGLAHAAASLPTAAPAATSAAPAPLLAKAPASMPQLECVRGFSKDYCNGKVVPAVTTFSSCLIPSPCKTLRLNGTFSTDMNDNNQACGSTVDATCNECIKGHLDVDANFLIRLQQNCPYRGCWDGHAVWTFADGTVYNGTLMGTMGVGTHRPLSTPMLCPVGSGGGRNCERCYDASFDPTTGLWRIGFEAAFEGFREETGEEVCFTLSGDFHIPGTATGGPNWSNSWAVAGTADGIWLTFCP